MRFKLALTVKNLSIAAGAGGGAYVRSSTFHCLPQFPPRSQSSTLGKLGDRLPGQASQRLAYPSKLSLPKHSHDPAMRRRLIRLLSVIVLLIPCRIVLAQSSTLTIEVLRTLGRDQEFGTLLGGAVAPDGTLLLADMSNNVIQRIDPRTGTVAMIGRAGRGPGEFSMLYRVAVAPDGKIFAFDLASGEVSTFATDGRFIRRAALPLALHQVGSMIVVGGRIVFTAPAFRAGPFSDSAVHLFDQDLRHLRSMGRIPAMEDKRRLEVLGTGFVTTFDPDHLLFTHRLTDSVAVFSLEGRPSVRLGLGRALAGRLEDAVQIEETDGRRTTRSNMTDIEYSTPAFRLDRSRFIVGRMLRGQQVFELFDLRGRRLAAAAPRPSLAMIGPGREPRTFWGITTDDDVPVIQLVRFSTP